jgi:glyoxylase-like metal-dependent hydrolase (beta-lactamase superfamily II)
MTQPNRKKIGDIEVTTVSDGLLNASLTHFLGIAHEDAARLSGFPVEGPVPLAVNAYLVTFNDKHALIDAGSGTTMGPTLGKVPENLRILGVAPELIDYVLLTHIHPDHSNGLTNDDGQPHFPNAEVIVSGEDAAFFLDRDPALGENEFRQRSMQAAQRAFAPYRGRTRRIKDGEIFTGISAHPQPGHTLGHTGWLVASGKDSLLIWGDIVHVAGVQFARPDAALTFDLDPEMARKSRQRVFDWVANDQIRVAGAHLDLPSYGYVTREGSGYAFNSDS